MSGRLIRSPKQTAAILFYCAHRSAVRSEQQCLKRSLNVHQVRSIQNTNVSNVRVSNEQK